jgi:hypothetical protein
MKDLTELKQQFESVLETFDKSFCDFILSQKFIVKTMTRPYNRSEGFPYNEKVIIIKHPYNTNAHYIIGNTWEDIEEYFETWALTYKNHADHYRNIFKEEIDKYKKWIAWLEKNPNNDSVNKNVKTKFVERAIMNPK